MNQENPLEILVVDDIAENRVAAIEGIARAYPDSNITAVADYIQAVRELESRRYSLLFLDLFFPEDETKPGRMPASDDRHRIFRDEEWQYFVDKEGNPPMGALLQLKTMDKGVRCIIFSDGDRHKDNYGIVKKALLSEHGGNYTLQGTQDVKRHAFLLDKRDAEGLGDKTNSYSWEVVATYVREYGPVDVEKFYNWR